MKIAINLEALKDQPRKFVSLLSEEFDGPTEFTAAARQKELDWLIVREKFKGHPQKFKGHPHI